MENGLEMAHRNGQRVVITITDKRNPYAPVTIVRGYVSDPERIIATCDDGHPIWNGCELRYGRAQGITFKIEPRAAMELHGIKEYKRPVRCYFCRTNVVLATRTTPHKCLECCMEAERGKRRS